MSLFVANVWAWLVVAASPGPVGTVGANGPNDGGASDGAALDLADIPKLQTISAHASQAAWSAVKGLGATKSQIAAVAKKKLVASVCDDLVDLRDLVEHDAMGKGFEFRDNVRGRSWARPTLALVMRDAMKAFREEEPTKTIAIGDVSQPGCGQVYHGVLVQLVRGAPAEDLVRGARWELGQRAVVDVKHGRDFAYEGDRFSGPEQPVRVATMLLGWRKDDDKTLVLKTGRVRWGGLGAASGDEASAMERDVAKIVASGALVDRHKIEVDGVDEKGKPATATLSHWVLESAKRQVIVVTDKAPGKRLDYADVRELRLSDWQAKKPGSTPGEVLWLRGDAKALPAVNVPVNPKGGKPRFAKPAAAAQFAWTHWEQLYEAGHITHLSGIDADLSYVTDANRAHFAVDLDAMDVQATFRWWELLVEAGKRLGTPVDAILVDPAVERHIKKSLPKKGPGAKVGSPVWALLARVGGHDGHHHVRIVEASAKAEKAAREQLGLK